MKLNKPLIATIGISLFSTIILGNLNTQQVKADVADPSIASTSNNNSTAGSTKTTGSTDDSTGDSNSANDSTESSGSTDTTGSNNSASTSTSDSIGSSSSTGTTDLTKSSAAASISDSVDSSNSTGSTNDSASASTLDSTDSSSSTGTTGSTSNSAPVSTSISTASTDSDDLQQANITFTDSYGNKVINSKNQEFSLSDKYSVGTDITSLLPDDFKNAYNIDSGQTTTITAGITDYNLKVTANQVSLIIYIYDDPAGTHSIKTNYEVYGKPDTLNYSSAQNVDEYSFNGYAFTKLVDRDGKDLPTANGSSITFTYDMPAVSNTDGNAYIVYAIYDVPTNQSLTVNYLDDQGNNIFTNTYDKYKDGTDIMTGDSIKDISKVLNFDTDKYTYWKTDPVLPFTLTIDTAKPESSHNSVDVYLLENDLNYTTVNYVDENNKIVYTDKIRSEVGQTVTPKDISKDIKMSAYHMVNPITDYTVAEKNATLNLPVTDAVHILQKINGDIIFDSQTTNKDFTDLLLKDDISAVDSIDYGSNDKVMGNLTPDELGGAGKISEILNKLSSDGINYAVINYKADNIPTYVSYQDDAGNEVHNFTLSATSNAIQDIKDNIPAYYSLTDEDKPYAIKDNKIVVTVKNNSASSIAGKDITLSNGQKWNPSDAISSVISADGKDMTTDEITAAIEDGSITTAITDSDNNAVDSLDTTKAGKYSVTYSYKDVTGKTVSSQPITLTIEAKDFGGIVAKDSTIKNGAS